MVECRVVIVGAGPAGIRCAETLVAAGLRPTVIDEGRRDGGQIYRRQPENFTRSYDMLYGSEARRAEAIHGGFDALRGKIDYLPETLVWNIAERQLYAAAGTNQIMVPFDVLILCSGAVDRLMPVKGWNLAGTFSLGGAQIALKSQACAIGKQVVFMGTGALLYLVAAQYQKMGAHVAAVLDTSPWSLRLSALPKLLAQPSVLWSGVKLDLTLRLAGVPVYNGIDPLEIEGTADAGVQGVSFKDRNGEIRGVACDAVALGYHLRPETQLADLARCAFTFDPGTRQWLLQSDPDGRSSVAGVYLAGDGARIRGARAAEASGRLAAMAALHDLGHPQSAEIMAGLRRTLARWTRFAQGLAQAFPWPAQQAARLSDDTVVCRCEAVTAAELRRVVLETDAIEANRAKAFSRVGMGRCQGRYCGQAAAEVIAHAAHVPVEQVGRLRGQAPVKPLPVVIGEDAA
ncbi:MAG: NAD(P)/FAD-dependent oxidoreductase [Rhodospirillaceae bacterium]|nr:MAG: NAD(P)/FAD-dependent oxidoreductase [Rhodospirillaceae bacterium]